MNGATKLDLFMALSQLSDTACGYTRTVRSAPAVQYHVRCDCKYGFHGPASDSKQTGCPEMEQAAHMIRSMTEAEFGRICRRAGIWVDGHEPKSRARRKPKATSLTHNVGK